MSPLMVPRARVAKMRARRALPVPVPAPFADSDPSSLCWYSKHSPIFCPYSGVRGSDCRSVRYRSLASEKPSAPPPQACPKLETYLSSLKSPNAAQKKINEKFYGVQSLQPDRVEAFRSFGCMGCGTSLHLFLNSSSGKHCEHAHLKSQTKYWVLGFRVLGFRVYPRV